MVALRENALCHLAFSTFSVVPNAAGTMHVSHASKRDVKKPYFIGFLRGPAIGVPGAEGRTFGPPSSMPFTRRRGHRGKHPKPATPARLRRSTREGQKIP
jgi:hypothetical protein